MNLNQVMLIGNIGNTPELRTTQKGIKVTNFSIATTERRKNSQSSTQWHHVVAWAEIAEYAAKHIKKGNLVLITGTLIYHQKEDFEGKKIQTVEIKALRIQNILRANKKDEIE